MGNIDQRTSPSISQLVEELDVKGVVCIDDLVSKDWLERARVFVLQYVEYHGSQDFSMRGPGVEESGPARTLLSETAISELMSGLAEAKWPRASRGAHVSSCLRVLAGSTRRETPSLLHYDAEVVTIIIPIFIPNGKLGSSGELVAFPNKRPFRRFALTHIVDKVAAQNRWYRRRALSAALREPGRHLVELKPGNAYLFWGYRAFHGNMPLAPNHLRATLILHYGTPHANSRIAHFASSRRARCVERWQDAVRPQRS